MPGKHYGKKKKVMAVLAADMTNPERVQEATGIPARQIRRWRNDPALLPYLDKSRDEMAEEMRGLSGMVLETIRKRLPEFEPRELVTLLGVSTEKALLLAGDATAMTETRDISGSLSDHDIIEAIRAAEQVASPTGSPTPDQVAPEG